MTVVKRTIPYFPKKSQKALDDLDPTRQMMTKKLITMFQTPTEGIMSKQTGDVRESNFTVPYLETAFDMACSLEKHIVLWAGESNKMDRINKFRSLYQILNA